MPVAEAIKNDREAYPLNRDQVRRLLDQWRNAPPDTKSVVAKRVIALTKVQLKCQLADLADDPDFNKEFTQSIIGQIVKDAEG